MPSIHAIPSGQSRNDFEPDSKLSPVGNPGLPVPIELTRDEFANGLGTLVARFSLGWLVAANLVGVWMALLLVRPKLGVALGEYSYGRWVPLHLDWQLYGWCALPLVGALFSWFLRPGAAALRQARRALVVWSLALCFGGLSWLHGNTTGKLFLDWIGSARLVLIGAQIFLWRVLAVNWWNTLDYARRPSYAAPLFLLALGSVPLVLLWASGRDVYPAIDPGTGGPIGTSLLGSTLGVVLIFSLAPMLLNRFDLGRSKVRRHWICFFASCAIFAMLDPHEGSHRDWRQIAGLATLLAWIPLLAIHLRGFRWNNGTNRWLVSTLCWWGLLVVTGFLEFWPGILDRIKFTHGLVAHAHLAMAGLLSSFNMLLLTNLGPESGPLAKRAPFALWHAGLAAHLCALAILATFEAGDAGWLFQRSSAETAVYVARLGAGIVMLAASTWWLLDATHGSTGNVKVVLKPA